MPGKIARRAGKYDAPACVGGAAPKLAVDEIGQPPEAEADRHHTGDIVVDAQPVELVPPRHQDNRKAHPDDATVKRSEEHTSELQSLMRISYAVFCLKKKK